MKLRVKSDGTHNGIWVEDEDGNRIEKVTSIELKAGVDSLPHVTIGFWVYPDEARPSCETGGKVVDATSLDDEFRTFAKLESAPVVVKFDATGTTPDVEDRITPVLEVMEEAASEIDKDDEHQG